MTTYKGIFFPNASSRAESVEISLSEASLVVTGEHRTEFSPEDCVFETVIANNPMTIQLPGGARLECADGKNLQRALNESGWQRKSLVFHMEDNWKLFAASFVVFVGVVFALVKFVIPAFSQELAVYVPSSWSVHLDDLILGQLDRQVFSKSELSDLRIKELRDYFSQAGLQDRNIQFRKGNGIKANAFALSGNTIIFTDELVNHMKHERLILAIALHEEGHLQERHVLQTILSEAAIGLMFLTLLGDISGVGESISGVLAILIAKKYVRDHETEADDKAVSSLVRMGFSPLCFSEALQKLSAYYKVRNVDNGLLDYFSTHPNVDDRTEAISRSYPTSQGCNLSTVLN